MSILIASVIPSAINAGPTIRAICLEFAIQISFTSCDKAVAVAGNGRRRRRGLASVPGAEMAARDTSVQSTPLDNMEGRPGRRRQPTGKDRPQSRSVGCAGGKTANQSYTRRGPAVTKNSTVVDSIKYVGLDVHKETIAVAVADSGTAEPRVLGIIPNDFDALRSLVKKLGSPSQLRICNEAGPCGYVIQRFLQRMKIDCVIVAPSLIPRKPGDRVKTDRRDASKLARLLRSGELTPTWIPDEQHEAVRA